MKIVVSGTPVTIKGDHYVFGPSSANAWNKWVSLVERGAEAGKPFKPNGTLHLRLAEKDGGGFFTYDELAAALAD